MNKLNFAALGCCLALTGCDNPNRDYDEAALIEPEITPVVTTWVTGTPKAGSSMAISYTCDSCQDDLTTYEWLVRYNGDTDWTTRSTTNVIKIDETEHDISVMVNISTYDLNSEPLEVISRTYDLTDQSTFNKAEFHSFSDNGYVLVINDSIYMSSDEAETMFPVRAHLQDPLDADTLIYPETMPALSEPNGFTNRQELYKFPNSRWGIGADANGLSSELVEFEGAELVIDCNGEFVTYEGSTISRFDETDLTTATYSYPTADTYAEFDMYCGNGIFVQQSGNTAIYLPEVSDPRPETEILITDYAIDSYFSNAAFSGYINTAGELVLLGNNLPAMSFVETGVAQVLTNVTSDEITVVLYDNRIFRIGDQGTTFSEQIHLSGETITATSKQNPTNSTDADLIDVYETSGGHLLLSSEYMTDGFYMATTESSCSELFVTYDIQATAYSTTGRDSDIFTLTDANNNIYACNTAMLESDPTLQITHTTLNSTNYNNLASIKGKEEVFVFADEAVALEAFTIGVDSNDTPTFNSYSLNAVDEIQLLNFGTNHAGSNGNVTRADGSQLIFGTIAEASGENLMTVSPLEGWDHLNTRCYDNICITVHANTEGSLKVSGITSVANVNAEYEGLIQ